MAFEQSKLDGENKRESERTLVLGTIRDALIELRTISQQLMNLMRDHDTWNRDLAQRTYPHAVDSMIAAEDADKAEIIMKVK